MKILALESEIEGGRAEQFQPHLEAEAARVYELFQKGDLRELYFNQEKHTAVLILECPDTVSARAILDTLPLVRAGLIAFEIIPLIPYPGFARLFAKSG
jgi:hypothetical protein